MFKIQGLHVIKKEIKRLEPAIQDGGFIPSCGHGIPKDVSWANYIDYTRIFAKAAGWL